MVAVDESSRAMMIVITVLITPSKRELHARMKNPSPATDRVRNRRVANRRLVKIKSLVVPPDHLVFEREEIGAEAEITRLTKLAEDLREAHISLESFRYDHCGTLYLE